VNLTADELAELDRWIKTARPLEGIYYRSVEYRFMNPDEVLNGRGTELYGGRFADVGTKAVYLAESDASASNEVLARKKRLGGQSQITIDKYPRIVFGVDVNLQRVVGWLRRPRSMTLATLREACLDENDLAPSKEVGEVLRKADVQGIRFPSVAGKGRNLIVYSANTGPGALNLRNVDQLKKKIAELSKA
jgi:RES domain-containing protein